MSRWVDNEAEINAALKQDLGKSFFEAQITDIKWIQSDIVFITKNLEKWAKDETPADIPLKDLFIRPKIRKDPLGCVLIIGPFNFPFTLTLGPLVGAIAAGNTVIIKPSEQAPASAALIQKLLESTLDPSCYRVINGGVAETKALLAEKWDKIFFTGSANVGKIVAQAAAPHLTPVALELGGRNAAIVTQNANLKVAASRLLWGKTFNTGQCCLSPNHVLVHKEVLLPLMKEFEAARAQFWPDGTRDSPDYARMISRQHFSRLKKMLDDTKGKVLMGGRMDRDEKYIEPTVIQVSSLDDSLLAEESFGPLMPIMTYDSLDQAISIANAIHETPLALYPFGSKEEVGRIIRETRSGGVSINDTVSHGTISTIEFGGVGDSGMGSYRGRASFECFVHRRVVTNTPTWMEKILAIRYPPYHGKLDNYIRLVVLKPNFDRDGNVKTGLLRYLLTLGSGTVSGGVLRAAVITVVVLFLKQAIQNRKS